MKETNSKDRFPHGDEHAQKSLKRQEGSTKVDIRFRRLGKYFLIERKKRKYGEQ